MSLTPNISPISSSVRRCNGGNSASSLRTCATPADTISFVGRIFSARITGTTLGAAAPHDQRVEARLRDDGGILVAAGGVHTVHPLLVLIEVPEDELPPLA